jgi:CheY-like chemotaxis protein
MYTPAADGWVAIGTDIHDRKLAEEALKAEHQRKDEFLAALAHELRNPLAPIRNAVAILARKGPQDPEVAWSQSVIERQIEQLSRLIGDLVDIERIARGNLALRRERVEGAGVGLRLVHGIVALHRGRVEARSAGPGRGAEFVVRLPLAHGKAVARQRAAPYAQSSPVRVLVADDNRDAADSLQRVLALYGHEVRVAYDGASALRIGAEFGPRVAVLDIAMRAMESGFDFHLVKPVDPNALNQLLADVAAKQ